MTKRTKIIPGVIVVLAIIAAVGYNFFQSLTSLPFGGGDNCFHNVLRDNLGQGYHQYVFARESYP